MSNRNGKCAFSGFDQRVHSAWREVPHHILWHRKMQHLVNRQAKPRAPNQAPEQTVGYGDYRAFHPVHPFPHALERSFKRFPVG